MCGISTVLVITAMEPRTGRSLRIRYGDSKLRGSQASPLVLLFLLSLLNP